MSLSQPSVVFQGRYDWRPGELQGELLQGEWAVMQGAVQGAAQGTVQGEWAAAAENAPALGVAAPPPSPSPSPSSSPWPSPSPPSPLSKVEAAEGAHDGANSASLLRRSRHAAWARVVATIAAANDGAHDDAHDDAHDGAYGSASESPRSSGDCGSLLVISGDEVAAGAAWRSGVRAWLSARHLGDDDAAQLDGLLRRGRAAHARAAEPPPWRTREDWNVEG